MKFGLLTFLVPFALSCAAGVPQMDGRSEDLCTNPLVPGTRICCGMPGERRGSNCVARETIEYNLAHCITEGDAFDAKNSSLGVFCCSGLSRLDEIIPAMPGNTTEGAPPGCGFGPVSLKRCTRCGDGECGKGETHCNCPGDCVE
jgi:hypothetical protein